MKALNPQSGNFEKIYVKALDSNVIGTILPYAGTTLPTNYMFCDGSAISRTTYADLFSAIGTTFGAGDGSTTFNLPNLKGRTLVGKDTSQTEFDTLGETGGSKYLQAHTHEFNIYSYYVTPDPSASSGPYGAGTSGKVDNIVGNVKGATTGDSGNLQPYIVVNYIIKVTQSSPLQASVVGTQSNSTTDAYSCDYANKAFGGTILWTNPNPNQAIETQTINVDLSDYDYIEVVTRLDANGNFKYISNKIAIGYGAKLINQWWLEGIGEALLYRIISAYSNIAIEPCYAVSLPTGAVVRAENNYLVPIQIIGYKTGLFS